MFEYNFLIDLELEIFELNEKYPKSEKPARERKPSPNIIVKRKKMWALVNNGGFILKLWDSKAVALGYLDPPLYHSVRVEIRGAK